MRLVAYSAICALVALLVSAALAFGQVGPPPITYVGGNSLLAWDHDGTDPGGSGLAGFDIEALDALGQAVHNDTVPPDARDYSLAAVPPTAVLLRVRARDNAGNVSAWAELPGLLIDRGAPDMVIRIRVEIVR